MYVNLPMVGRIARRLMAGRWVGLTDLASRTLTLCAEESHLLRPAVYPEGTLERIKSLSPWREWGLERLLIKGGRRRCAPTLAHLIEGVAIVEAGLYARGARVLLGYGPERLIVTRTDKQRRIASANLVTTWSGSHFFGSLLLDDFTLELIAEDPEHNVTMITKPFRHEPEYRALLGIEATAQARRARVDRLFFYEDATHNSHKARRYGELRRRLRASLALQAGSGPPGVYLRRGAAGDQRVLSNEAEVESLLRNAGYDIVDTTALAAEEIARRTLGARIVVGIEGSHLSHGIFSMAEDGAMVVIQPPDRFAMVYKEFTDCLGMRFAFLVGEGSSAGYAISLAELAGILESLS